LLTPATEIINQFQRQTLLNQLSELLPTLQQNALPAADLVERLVRPESVTFAQILSIKPSVDFVAGLTPSASSFNLATLHLLEKATRRPSDIEIVAGKGDVVRALVKLWLSTADTAVADKAHGLLVGLLCEEGFEHPEKVSIAQVNNQNINDKLMWRRFFRDKSIYGSIFSLCSLQTVGQDGQPSKRYKTIAQSRLLELLLKIRNEPTRTSQIPEIESEYGVSDGGLLQYATLHMIDYEDDELLLELFIGFCSSFVKFGPTHDDPAETFAINFMKQHELHEFCMSFFFKDDSSLFIELTSADYLVSYCYAYPKDLLRDRQLCDKILNRITGMMPSFRIQPSHARVNCLNILKYFPRAWLLARRGGTPVFMLAKIPNGRAYDVLGTIFSGGKGQLGRDDKATENQSESAAARALYFLNLEANPGFWDQVLKAADTIAITDTALSAIQLIGRLLVAKWAPLPLEESPPGATYSLPTERWLAEKCNLGRPLPETGVEAIMDKNTADNVIRWFMTRPVQFSNVGGGKGDIKNAAWRVAVAKYDVLVLFLKQLEQMDDSDRVDVLVEAIGTIVALGPQGGRKPDEARVATMER